MSTNQQEKEFVNIEKVNFSTDGNKSISMLIDYKTNITEDFILNANLYENCSNGNLNLIAGEPMFVNNKQSVIRWKCDDLCNLKSKLENVVNLQLEIAKLPNDESLLGEDPSKYEQVICKLDYVIKVYYEHHFFGKNILEIRK